MTDAHRFKFLVCIDRSPSSRAAVRFASLRAGKIGGLVALLHVIDPPAFQHWMTVAEHMEQEEREEAEQFLHQIAAYVQSWSGVISELHIRVGDIGDEILAVIAEDPDIDALVVGAAPAGEREHGRLVAWLAAHLAEDLDIPLVIVPGNLTDEQIDRHT